MKRLHYIDVAKGICMLLIMFGHCSTGTEVRHSFPFITWIYSFHTTTFFIITGFLMAHVNEARKPLKNTLVSNGRRLLLPYFIFQTIYTLWYCLKYGFHNLLWLPIDIILLVDWDYATWFLLVLFFSKMLANAICKLKSNAGKSICFVCVYVIALFLIRANIMPRYDWLYRLLLRSMLGTGFISIGFLFYKYKTHFRNPFVLAISLGISVVASLYNGLVSTFYLSISNPVLYTIAAIAGGLLILSIASFVQSKFLQFFGKESVIALGVHQIVLWSFPFQSVFLWFTVTPITALIMYSFTLFRKYLHHTKSSRQ